MNQFDTILLLFCHLLDVFCSFMLLMHNYNAVSVSPSFSSSARETFIIYELNLTLVFNMVTVLAFIPSAVVLHGETGLIDFCIPQNDSGLPSPSSSMQSPRSGSMHFQRSAIIVNY